MPTIKPKMNLVLSNERIKKMLDRALDDRCELNGTNRSWEVEQILRATLLPADEALALSVERLYLGESTVKDEACAVLANNAAGVNWKAKNGDMRPFVELAAQQSHGALLDMSNGSIFHLREAWGSVCELLGQAKENDIQYKAEEECAREFLRILNDGTRIEAKRFFDAVLLSWEVLGSSTHTFRALADVVDMADRWPNDAQARESFKACLWRIVRARDGE
jgi:hypothetical protein